MAALRSGVLQQLRYLVTDKDAQGITDRQLLDCFTRQRDEAAFAALVRRHGPLVLGVCRRVLQNAHDAEDVFQATFLVLARKAGSVSRAASLGSWLYQVAYRMALKIRKQASNRRKREERVVPRAQADPLAEVSGRELLVAFDEELQNLPERYRTPLILCYLEGKTRDQAAGQLGCSASTLHRRLEQARARMRVRLERRGLVLPAALFAAGLTGDAACAGMPAALPASTVQAAMLVAGGKAAAGVCSARVAGLVQGALHALRVAKLKSAGAVLLAAGFVATGWLAWGAPTADRPPPSLQVAAAPAVAALPAEEDQKQTMTVTGRVVDADGKPLKEAPVAVVIEPKAPGRGAGASSERTRVLGRGRADGDGRFRLTVPRPPSSRDDIVFVVAGASAHGFGWQVLHPRAERLETDVRLPRDLPFRGQLVDLQGKLAAGVTVWVKSIGTTTPGEFHGVQYEGKAEDLPPWPMPVRTDAEGRFLLHGLSTGLTAILGVSDDRFATQDLVVRTDAKSAAKDFMAALAPAHIIEGVARYADTGKAVANAYLVVDAGMSELGSFMGLEAQADGEGRFRLNPYPGSYFIVSAYGPEGQSYLTIRHSFSWPSPSATKHQIELKLPRGVLVRGRITEAGTGAPVAVASVQYLPRRDNPNIRNDVPTGWANVAVSRADGTFGLCVLPGAGHLRVHGPTSEYVLQERGQNQLDAGQPGGVRIYAHAFAPLELASGAEPRDLAVTLQRGVTVRGRLLGPDGKSVAEALLISRLHLSPGALYWRGFPLRVQDGRFEVHGLDPEKSYPVYFLDPKQKLGATVELFGKQAGSEVTVRLAPCGAASVRVVDAGGQPLAKQQVNLQMVVTPGPDRQETQVLSGKSRELAADSDFVANIDRLNHWNDPLTDNQGRVTFQALIPGATYRILGDTEGGIVVQQEFTVESGKTRQLADIVRQR
jgi:RNA polymerase sigma factor (sigma-70 family)